MAERSQEPGYHSRLHTADTLVSMTSLLLKQRELDGLSEPVLNDEELLLLVTMVGHDALHDGRRNNCTAQLEQMSADFVHQTLVAHSVQASDCTRIRQLILRTDPACVEAHHAQARRQAFDLTTLEWQTTVVVESDILASVLPEFQSTLTSKLAAEWAVCDKEGGQMLLSSVGRIRFLRHSALFSSPASLALGLPQLVQEQILALQPSSDLGGLTELNPGQHPSG